MKIAIDTFGSEHGRSGFGSYILNFISNLPQEISSQELTGTTINADTNKNAANSENPSENKTDIQIEIFGLEDTLILLERTFSLHLQKFLHQKKLNKNGILEK